MKMLSIIVVTYNDSERLVKTLNSLEAYYNDLRYQIIVIDGNSSDGTKVSVKKYLAHENINFISENDNGIYDAMNKGVKLSNCDYSLFLNCGDTMIVAPELLYQNLINIDKMSNYNIILYMWYFNFNNNKKIKYPTKSIRYKMPASHQAMIFSTKFCKENKFNINFIIAGDYDLYLKISKSDILIDCSNIVLTSVEYEGYSNRNPIISYHEYSKSIISNIHGIEKYILLLFVILKASLIIPIKYLKLDKCLKKKIGIL